MDDEDLEEMLFDDDVCGAESYLPSPKQEQQRAVVTPAVTTPDAKPTSSLQFLHCTARKELQLLEAKHKREWERESRSKSSGSIKSGGTQQAKENQRVSDLRLRQTRDVATLTDLQKKRIAAEELAVQQVVGQLLLARLQVLDDGREYSLVNIAGLDSLFQEVTGPLNTAPLHKAYESLSYCSAAVLQIDRQFRTHWDNERKYYQQQQQKQGPEGQQEEQQWQEQYQYVQKERRRHLLRWLFEHTFSPAPDRQHVKGLAELHPACMILLRFLSVFEKLYMQPYSASYERYLLRRAAGGGARGNGEDDYGAAVGGEEQTLLQMLVQIRRRQKKEKEKERQRSSRIARAISRSSSSSSSSSSNANAGEGAHSGSTTDKQEEESDATVASAAPPAPPPLASASICQPPEARSSSKVAADSGPVGRVEAVLLKAARPSPELGAVWATADVRFFQRRLMWYMNKLHPHATSEKASAAAWASEAAAGTEGVAGLGSGSGASNEAGTPVQNSSGVGGGGSHATVSREWECTAEEEYTAEAVEAVVFASYQVCDTLSRIFELANAAQDAVLHPRIVRLHSCSAEQLMRALGVRERFMLRPANRQVGLPPPYHAAICALQQLPTLAAPTAKLRCLVCACDRVNECVKQHYAMAEAMAFMGAPAHGQSGGHAVCAASTSTTAPMDPSKLVLGADDLLPIMSFIAVQAVSATASSQSASPTVPSAAVSWCWLHTQAALLSELILPHLEHGRKGYSLATLHTAIMQLSRMPLPEGGDGQQ